MLIRAVDAVNEVVGRVISVVAFVLTVVIIYDVVMRYAFNAPTRWAFDVSKQLYGFYFIMLGGYALRHGAHVRVDLVTEHLSPRVRRWVDVLGYALFFFPFTWVFLSNSYTFALRSWKQGETTYGSVQLPVYPLKIAVAVAAALLFVQGIAELFKLILGREETRVG